MKNLFSFALFLLATASSRADFSADVTYCENQVLPRLKQPSTAQDFYCLGIRAAGVTGSQQQNDAEAAKWYRRAADMGHAGAQDALGYSYATGRGVPQSYTEALKWYRRAAEQGNSDSMNAIGGLYEFGRGVPRDQPEANRWFERAKSSSKRVYQAGHSVFDTGERQYRESNDPAPVNSSPRASEVEFQTGYQYEHGEGVPKNLAVAARWYGRAAAAGDARAQVNLGRMYESGQGVPEDRVKAAEWWSKSAAQGNVDGMFELGRAYEFGIGVQPNHATAQRWFEEAAQRGDTRARTYLQCINSGGREKCRP